MSPADPSRPVAERRGAFEPYPGWTWEALLLKAEADPAEALAACGGVGAVERDITAAVLAGTWEPPVGAWALLVVPAATDWATLATARRYPSELIEEFLGDYRGETLLAGYQDTAGVLHFTHRRHAGDQSEDVVRFETDGDLGTLKEPFDPEADDFDPETFDDDSFLEGTTLTGAAFAPEKAAAWLADRTDDGDALQTLLADAGAYVPLYRPVGDGPVRLETHEGHGDALAPEQVAQIDLIRFGPLPEAEPTRGQIAAGRKLAKAIEKDDPAAVRAALAKGAPATGTLTDDRATALWRACDSAGYGRPRAAEIVAVLLDAGADPDDPACGFDSPLLRVVRERAAPVVKADLIRRLAAAGADVNAAWTAGAIAGDRPLHTAALKGFPDLVELLLELGADPLAENAHGRTPRRQLAFTREANAGLFEETAEERAADARSAALLEAAERDRGASRRDPAAAPPSS